MGKIRTKWINLALHSGDVLELSDALKYGERLYGLAKLDKPIVLVVDSPLAAQYAIPIAKKYIKNMKADQVYDQVYQVADQVADQVRGQVAEFKTFSYDSLGWSSGWASFYDFFEEIGVVKHKEWSTYKKFLESGVWNSILLEGLCVFVRRPKEVLLDNQGRLHSTDKSAISWRDGYSIHAIHGVRFENNLKTWQKLSEGKLKAAEAMEVKDVDQRAVCTKYLGIKEMIKALNAELVSKGELRMFKHLPNRFIERVYSEQEADIIVSNRLYKVKDYLGSGDTEYFLHYQDPSTEKDHMSFVTPLAKEHGEDADALMGAKHHMSKETYLAMELEA